MKTFIITATVPPSGSGETAEVTVLAPSGKTYHRGPIQPAHVAFLSEIDLYPADLMHRMFPVAARGIHGSFVMFDSRDHDDATLGHVTVWGVDTDDF